MQAHPASEASNPSLEEVLAIFEASLTEAAPFMRGSYFKQRQLFGSVWDKEFGELLRLFVAPDNSRRTAAVEGYVEFALNGMRLQKIFEKTREYQNKSYAQASAEVYHNRDFMFASYLPGLMLSHYLWPHHYRQKQFFEQAFLSRFTVAPQKEFCDIGVGTGFYSRLLLASSPEARGWAFDISESALEYSKKHLAAYGVADRWNSEIRDVTATPAARTWPFLICVEVLEHLEDPLSFLKSLYGLLESNGMAFISAAVTAAETDHIYLYNSAQEVLAQLEEAGFKVVEWQEDKAYASQADNPVPSNVAFILQRGD